MVDQRGHQASLRSASSGSASIDEVDAARSRRRDRPTDRRRVDHQVGAREAAAQSDVVHGALPSPPPAAARAITSMAARDPQAVGDRALTAAPRITQRLPADRNRALSASV